MARRKKSVTPPKRIETIPQDYRCPGCGRLLFRAILPASARIEIVCWHQSCRRHIVINGGATAKEQRKANANIPQPAAALAD